MSIERSQTIFTLTLIFFDTIPAISITIIQQVIMTEKVHRIGHQEITDLGATGQHMLRSQ